jgi:hypothetical protein
LSADDVGIRADRRIESAASGVGCRSNCKQII